MTKPMTPRERVLTALRRQEPDRVPIDLGACVTTIEVDAYDALKAHLGIDHLETTTFVRLHAEPDEEVLRRFRVDTRYVRMKPPATWTLQIDDEGGYYDEWGVRYQKPASSLYFDPVEHPLAGATLKDLAAFKWPDPADRTRIEGLAARARALREDTEYAVVLDMPMSGVFEVAMLLRGFAEFLMDLAGNKPFAQALLAELANYQVALYGQALAAAGEYISVVWCSDDLGMQDRPMMSRKTYAQLVFPAQARVWQGIKSRSDVQLVLHSCGSISGFLPYIIEGGVDAIHPVQPLATGMQPARIKQEFGDRLSFWGGVDIQRVLPYGTPADVEREVALRIEELGPGGGYVCTPAHNVQPGVPAENVCALYDAAYRHGVYASAGGCS